MQDALIRDIIRTRFLMKLSEIKRFQETCLGDEPMRKDLFGQREARGHQQRRPHHGVEAQNVLACRIFLSLTLLSCSSRGASHCRKSAGSVVSGSLFLVRCRIINAARYFHTTYIFAGYTLMQMTGSENGTRVSTHSFCRCIMSVWLSTICQNLEDYQILDIEWTRIRAVCLGADENARNKLDAHLQYGRWRASQPCRCFRASPPHLPTALQSRHNAPCLFPSKPLSL